MDIKGAFDNTLYDSIEEAANGKGFHPAVTTWIKAMLSERKVKATVAEEPSPRQRSAPKEEYCHRFFSRWL